MPNRCMRQTDVTKFLLSLVVVLALGTLGIVAVKAQCYSCQPSRIGGVSVQGTKKVCFDGSFTSEDENWIKAGGTWWNERLSTRTPVVYFEFALPGDLENCNIMIGLDYGMIGTSTAARAYVTPNGDGALIEFNPSRFSTENFNYISFVSGHEFYHILGWTDLQPPSLRETCDGSTLLAGSYSGHPGLPTGMLCGDVIPVASSYPPSSGVDCSLEPGHPDCSPLVIDTAGNGFAFTSARKGVLFDLDGDGNLELVGWTQRNSDEAWLAIDLNGNGNIDSGLELFGNVTRGCNGETAANGFEALKLFEAPCFGSSVQDGTIDRRDAIFDRLLLWRDINKDGGSTPDELTPVSSSPLRAIYTDYATIARVRKGNEIRQVSFVKWGNDRRFIVDVWLDTHVSQRDR
jgi:hypothetical protein